MSIRSFLTENFVEYEIIHYFATNIHLIRTYGMRLELHSMCSFHFIDTYNN